MFDKDLYRVLELTWMFEQFNRMFEFFLKGEGKFCNVKLQLIWALKLKRMLKI
jgi:hypothetical protein